MALAGGRGAQETPGAAFFSSEFKGYGGLLQHLDGGACCDEQDAAQSLFQASNRARLPVMQCSRLPLTDASHRFFLGSEARAAFMRPLEVLPER